MSPKFYRKIVPCRSHSSGGQCSSAIVLLDQISVFATRLPALHDRWIDWSYDSIQHVDYTLRWVASRFTSPMLHWPNLGLHQPPSTAASSTDSSATSRISIRPCYPVYVGAKIHYLHQLLSCRGQPVNNIYAFIFRNVQNIATTHTRCVLTFRYNILSDVSMEVKYYISVLFGALSTPTVIVHTVSISHVSLSVLLSTSFERPGLPSAMLFYVLAWTLHSVLMSLQPSSSVCDCLSPCHL